MRKRQSKAGNVPARTQAAEMPGFMAAPGGPRRDVVFVAEDDADLRPVIGELLVEAGYRPVLFETGTKLLASLDRATPSAIVTDMGMPGLSGSDLLTALRQDGRLSRIPVVVMTATNDTALPLRVDAPVVYKPGIVNLVPIIGRALAESRALAARATRRGNKAGA